MRCFIAIPLSRHICDAIVELAAPLRKNDIRASWVKSDQMHLTLRFLGEIPDDVARRIDTSLRNALAETSPLPLSVKGLGAFPKINKPTIVWAGVESLDGKLVQVQAHCESAARAAGLPEENRKFHPHITIARIKDFRVPMQFVRALQNLTNTDIGEFEATHVSLFKSELTPRGPIHTQLQEYRFL